MTSKSTASKKGFIVSFLGAYKNMTHDLPLLWKNYKGLIFSIIISSVLVDFLLKIFPKSGLFFYAAFSLIVVSLLFHSASLFMLNVRILQGVFSEQGIIPVGWKGIKWSMRETRLLGTSFILVLFVMIATLIFAGIFYLSILLLNGFPLNFSISNLLTPENFLSAGILFLGISILFFYTFSRISFFSFFAAAKIKNSFRSSLSLTRNHKFYVFYILILVLVLYLALILLFVFLNSILKGGNQDVFLSLVNIFGVVFITYLQIEVFKQIAAPELKKKVTEGFSPKA